MMGKKGRLGLMLIVLAVILTAMLSIFMGSTGAYLQDFSNLILLYAILFLLNPLRERTTALPNNRRILAISSNPK